MPVEKQREPEFQEVTQQRILWTLQRMEELLEVIAGQQGKPPPSKPCGDEEEIQVITDWINRNTEKLSEIGRLFPGSDPKWIPPHGGEG